jgi:predicted ATPase
MRLLPELEERALVPAPPSPLPPQGQRLLLAAVARYLANGAGPSGTLLVLDDLQWAGVDALDLLESLLRTPGAQALRVVGAYRSTQVRLPGPLLALLAWRRKPALCSRASWQRGRTQTAHCMSICSGAQEVFLPFRGHEITAG